MPGWESNPPGGLILRNLLIPRNDKIEKNCKDAELRYTPGTRNDSRDSSACGVRANRSMRLACHRPGHLHGQQVHRLRMPLTQQPLAILPRPRKFLNGVYSMRPRHARRRRARLQRLVNDPPLLRHTPEAPLPRLTGPHLDRSFRSVHVSPSWTLPVVPTRAHLPHSLTRRPGVQTVRLRRNIMYVVLLSVIWERTRSTSPSRRQPANTRFFRWRLSGPGRAPTKNGTPRRSGIASSLCRIRGRCQSARFMDASA